MPTLNVTVMAQPTDDSGHMAAELLMQCMAKPARTPLAVVLEGGGWHVTAHVARIGANPAH